MYDSKISPKQRAQIMFFFSRTHEKAKKTPQWRNIDYSVQVEFFFGYSLRFVAAGADVNNKSPLLVPKVDPPPPPRYLSARKISTMDTDALRNPNRNKQK